MFSKINFIQKFVNYELDNPYLKIRLTNKTTNTSYLIYTSSQDSTDIKSYDIIELSQKKYIYNGVLDSVASDETQDEYATKQQQLLAKWSLLLQAIKQHNIPENLINYFTKMAFFDFHCSLINFLQIDNNDNLTDYRYLLSKFFIGVDDIIQQLCELIIITNNHSVQYLQKKLYNSLYVIVDELKDNIRFNIVLDISNIKNKYKYTQASILTDEKKIVDQFRLDSCRKFCQNIKLTKNNKAFWSSSCDKYQAILKTYYNSYINKRDNLAMESWIKLCKEQISCFIKKCNISNKQQTINAIMLEATQSGSAVLHLVLKNYLIKQLNLPLDNYCLYFGDHFSYSLDANYKDDHLIIKDTLAWYDGIYIQSLSGIDKINVAKINPLVVSGNLNFNLDFPINSFYDTFTINTIPPKYIQAMQTAAVIYNC